MKTWVFGLYYLGLTTLCFSQNYRLASQLQPQKNLASQLKNDNYFQSVYELEASNEVKNLEDSARNYDIKTSELFNNTYENYEITFESLKGKIIAIYDVDGVMIKSIEKFDDVKLPEAITKTLHREYPDWILNSTNYRVNYYLEHGVHKVYNVQVENNHKKVNLKIDCKGHILHKSL